MLPKAPMPKKRFLSLQPSQLSISSSEDEVEVVGSSRSTKSLKPSQLSILSLEAEVKPEVGGSNPLTF